MHKVVIYSRIYYYCIVIKNRYMLDISTQCHSDAFKVSGTSYPNGFDIPYPYAYNIGKWVSPEDSIARSGIKDYIERRAYFIRNRKRLYSISLKIPL